jgi:hypothetical protein
MPSLAPLLAGCQYPLNWMSKTLVNNTSDPAKSIDKMKTDCKKKMNQVEKIFSAKKHGMKSSTQTATV